MVDDDDDDDDDDHDAKWSFLLWSGGFFGHVLVKFLRRRCCGDFNFKGDFTGNFFFIGTYWDIVWKQAAIRYVW